MKDSKLVDILRTLSAEEFKELEKFVASPYFSRGRDLSPFLKTLKPFYPAFTHDNLNNDYIFSKLYPGKDKSKINTRTITKTLSSDLIKAIKDFFKQVEFKNDSNRGNFYLANQLRTRKLYKEFEKEYKDSLTSQEKSNGGSVADLIEKYFLLKVQRDYSLDINNFEHSYEANLSMGEYSVIVALINTFKHEDEKNLADAYKIKVRNNLMDYMLNNLDSEKLLMDMEINNDKFYPYLKIFYMIYKMNSYKDKREYYFELKDLLNKHMNLFGQPEIYVLWNIMLTYCGVNSRGSKEEFFENEIFEIQKYMLEKGIYKKSDNEDFHIVLFRNIVSKASMLGDYEWLESFINKYSNELHIDHRDNMKYYSLAYLYFVKGQFGKALEQIVKVKYDLFIYKIDMKILLLEIYYELKYFDQVYSGIDTTLHYLKNTNDLSDYFKDHGTNFVKYIKELLRINSSTEKSTSEIEFLKKRIENEKIISQREWLLKKVKELK